MTKDHTVVDITTQQIDPSADKRITHVNGR